MHTFLKTASAFAALFLCAALLFSGCEGTAGNNNEKESVTMTNNVCITVKNFGKIRIELYPDKAPITVENFKKLVAEGHYDGTIFHRVINGFMIQGGAGSYASNIKGEFAANGVQNDLSHVRGVVSMARAKAYDSASDQFFICQGSPTYLDGN